MLSSPGAHFAARFLLTLPDRFLRQRFAAASLLALFFLFVSLATRLALASRPEVVGSPGQFLAAFLVGIGYDFATLTFLLAPLVLFLAALPNRLAASRRLRGLIALGIPVAIFLSFFTAAAEWIFWNEFGSRFNFIAVDYLLYTHEVIGNIWQSYPVGRILTALAVASLLLAWPMMRHCWPATAQPLRRRDRMISAALALALPVAVYYGLSSTDKNRFASDALNELGGNGLYEFAAAARNNEMDFMRLYATLPERDALSMVREKQAASADSWRSADPEDRMHSTRSDRAEKRLNVVLVSVESFGAEFIGAWGNGNGLTPRIDELAKNSLIFTRTYATGNRTVRGLEALALSIPPTPGQSIVKRPKNEHLFTLGDVFENKGYATAFIYGGYSYFDNMSAFFSHNDYRVIDRQAIPAEKIHYENIWGVADEDLFDLAIGEIDASIAKSQGKKPVFAHIMTTSNHRPYTYPAGRVDIPPGTGREGAVKYTDWAIGHFIDEARKKPWFPNTLFVITADHGANARGTGEIPVDKYLIPVLFYSPAHIPAGRIDRLMSQIDIAPTLLGRLGFSYDSKFFGQDMFRLPPGEERAFVANYSSLGYLRDGRLVMLYPKKRQQVSVNRNAGEPGARAMDEDALKKEAIAWYESASLAFGRQRYLEEEDDDDK